MTLLPSESWDVRGVEGDRYKVGPWCEAPGCKRPVDHKHHLWRRSHLAGDWWWVKVPDGTTVRNVIGLCWHHHEDVTGSQGGHKAWVKWVSGFEFAWLEMRSTDGNWQQTGTFSLPAPPPEAVPADSGGREAERCPTCGRQKTKAHVEHEPGPKRPRKSWTIRVPSDADKDGADYGEDGAAILDELIEGCAEVFGMEEYTSALARYYVVVRALTVVLQNRELIAAEVDA